jgi:HK97 family phage major capsid protein
VQNFSGVKYASGVNNFTLSTTTGTGGSAPSYQDLVSMIYTGLQAATRTGAGFFMSPFTFKNIVGLTDTTGQPIFSFANVPNAIPNFVGGYPVYLISSLSTQWTNGSNGSSACQMYYGPGSKIIYGDSTGMTFDIDPYFFFDTVKTRIRILKRTGIIVPVGAYFTVGLGARSV